MIVSDLNFIYEGYNFVLFGTSIGKITFKVSSILGNPEYEKFYKAIMENEKLDLILGIVTNQIVLDKKSYIDIDTNSGTYYLMLTLKTMSVDVYTEFMIGNCDDKIIYDEFYPILINGVKYPFSITINRMFTGVNSFDSVYYISYDISNVENSSSISYDIMYELFVKNTGILINKYINPTLLMEIGFEKHFIEVDSHDSVRIVGYMRPNTINEVKVYKVLENTLIIEDSEKWKNLIHGGSGYFNSKDIIPYIYNNENMLYYIKDILDISSTVSIENGNVIYKFVTDTVLMHLSKFKTKFNISMNVSNEIFFSIHSNENYEVFKNINKFSNLKYIGYIIHNKHQEFADFIKSQKKFKKKQINIFYTDENKAYFFIKSTFKFKVIYDSIRNKLKHKGRGN